MGFVLSYLSLRQGHIDRLAQRLSSGDTTAPFPPLVTACGSANSGSLSAVWQANDPQSSIKANRYAIGLKPGGTEVKSAW